MKNEIELLIERYKDVIRKSQHHRDKPIINAGEAIMITGKINAYNAVISDLTKILEKILNENP